jgi:hypothetical protein
MHVERISYDIDFITRMMPTLDAFFLEVIFVLRKKNQQQLPMTYFAFADEGNLAKVIAYDSPHCEYTWFHYSCLNLPINFDPGERDWLCPECSRKSEHLPYHFSTSTGETY